MTVCSQTIFQIVFWKNRGYLKVLLKLTDLQHFLFVIYRTREASKKERGKKLDKRKAKSFCLEQNISLISYHRNILIKTKDLVFLLSNFLTFVLFILFLFFSCSVLLHDQLLSFQLWVTKVKVHVFQEGQKIDKIFTVDLTLGSKCQIDDEDFVNFCDVLRKYEL